MEKDLKNYKIRTDLAIDEKIKNNENVIIEESTYGNVRVTRVTVLKKLNNINKKPGIYITLEFDDATDYNNCKMIEKIFIKELKKLIKNVTNVLIVGLGNRDSTADSIGPLTTERIIVTNHLYELNLLDDGFKRVSVINPGVMAQTGLETFDVIKSVINVLCPDLIIAVDSLASSSLDRLNKTIQITDSGIAPGSGIGNKRKELSRETLGIPVIGIGSPTVVDAVTIVNDTIDYMYKHYAYNKKNINNPINKLVIKHNYLEDNIEPTMEDKSLLFGIVGTLKPYETKRLIYEVLSPIGYNLMVTPKEIDFAVKKISDIIANGINNALNEKVDHL